MKTTLLITIFNRSSLLRNSLNRLKTITIPDDILIVDDGSTGSCKSVVDEFAGVLPLRYIYNNNPAWSICSMARNIGIKNTDADVIITAEPEMLFVTDVIPQVLKDMQDHPLEIISAGTIYHMQVSCPFHPGWYTNPLEALKDCKVENYQVQPRPYAQGGLVKTVNMQATFIGAYRREWLLEIGGWDESFPGAWGFDDIEVATRLRINGINQFIDPDMQSIHQWHPHLPPHIQGPAMFANEEYMKSKKLDTMKKGDPGLIANKGKEWGIII